MKRLALVSCLFLAGVLPACADRTPTANAPAATTISAALAALPGPGEAIPTGERLHGQSVLEPVYDDEHAGAIGYVSTPLHAPMRANPRAWAPFYVVVYPTTSTVVTSGTTLLCLHTPVENCPDHGPDIAGLAQQVEPNVYGAGVAGHDHLMDFPGGEDFNVAWEPIIVLFTNSAAADHHLLTDTQIDDAVANGDAIEIPAPALTFHCAAVAKVVYTRATPIS
jgi:hypothetical protein